jgi:hypothetical protein
MLIYVSLVTQPASPLFKWMWKSSPQNKHKFIFWLLHKDRLNTRNHFKRDSMALDCATPKWRKHCFISLFYCSLSQGCCCHHLHIHWDTSLKPLDVIIQLAPCGSSCFVKRSLLIALIFYVKGYWVKVRNNITPDSQIEFSRSLDIVMVSIATPVRNIWLNRVNASCTLPVLQ